MEEGTAPNSPTSPSSASYPTDHDYGRPSAPPQVSVFGTDGRPIADGNMSEEDFNELLVYNSRHLGSDAVIVIQLSEPTAGCRDILADAIQEGIFMDDEPPRPDVPSTPELIDDLLSMEDESLMNAAVDGPINGDIMSLDVDVDEPTTSDHAGPISVASSYESCMDIDQSPCSTTASDIHVAPSRDSSLPRGRRKIEDGIDGDSALDRTRIRKKREKEIVNRRLFLLKQTYKEIHRCDAELLFVDIKDPPTRIHEKRQKRPATKSAKVKALRRKETQARAAAWARARAKTISENIEKKIAILKSKLGDDLCGQVETLLLQETLNL